MHTRIRILLIGLSLLTVTVVLVSAYKATAQREPIALGAGQSKARIMVTRSHLRPPLEITVVKTQKRELEPDKEFLDEEDWLRGLTIRLVNNSGKTVTFIGMELIFWRTEEQPTGFPAAWPLRRGLDPFSIESANSPDQPEVELALPGGDLEFVLSDAQYDDIKRFLKDNEFPDSIKKVEIQVVKIGFSDGTAWNGRMYRRDPKSLKGPIRGWTPVEEVGWERPQRNLQGAARNRTAFAAPLTCGPSKRIKLAFTGSSTDNRMPLGSAQNRIRLTATGEEEDEQPNKVSIDCCGTSDCSRHCDFLSTRRSEKEHCRSALKSTAR